MADKQFDEALVTHLKNALFDYLTFGTRRDLIETLLTSLSSTHAIVPKEEYEETVRLLRRVGQLQKVKIDSAIDQHPGEQAAAWGDDWTALLEAIAVHIAKEASPCS